VVKKLRTKDDQKVSATSGCSVILTAACTTKVREGAPMMDQIRRNILATGAAATALAAAPRVLAQQAGPTIGFYEKGNIRIRYAEVGSGFPLLVTPAGA
jgi:hypothetical protein